MKKTILLDVDEVLRDTISTVLDIYNRDFKPEKPVKVEDVNYWDLSRTLTKVKDPYQYFFVDRAEEVFLHSKPFEDNLEEILRSINNRYNIHIVSNQPKGKEEYTLQWLNDYKASYDDITFTPYKGKVNGDIALDDSVKNLDDYANNGKLPMVMDRPWNRECKYPRVYDMNDFNRFLRENFG